MKIIIKKNKKGFTMVEILLVIAFIAVVVPISVIALKPLQLDYQLNGSVRNMMTDLRYAQQITLTEQVKYCVKIFPEQRKYQVIKCIDSSVILEKQLPSDITSLSFSGFTSNIIEFNPYGAVKESGSILLENKDNKTKTIEVRPSGFVRIAN
jgi:prepilin-type N-terminal cleavage/methylation domain-containing protein